MKTLIAFGVGMTLGLSLKKKAKIKEPKIFVVDDRNSLGEHLFSDEAKEVFKQFYKDQKPSS
ncbi:hypothetical protein BVG18_00285 [Acinetobacter lwoffii]|uniref:hypothetical protein n=1 Tax=Acinetobacter lwoffii TaxID=28090 RepID=UPI000A32055B|nr:hypothetical protein BVG18_00285 [Acinetobacter lwoffii]